MVDDITAELQSDLANLLEANVKEKNKGETFLGDFTQYAGIEISYFGGELALLFVLQILIYQNMMGKLNGRFLRMQQWLHSLDFEILGRVIKGNALMMYLSIVGYSYIIFPFVTLLLWGIYLFKDADKNPALDMDYKNPVFLGGISVYLIGIAIVLVITAFTKIAWNNYRFKLIHTIIFTIAYIAFTAWQFMVMFSSIHGKFNFQGLSACFLTQSGMVMCAFVYQNLYENKFNLVYFMNKFVKSKGEKPDPEREEDFLKEIEIQKANEDWLPSIYDITDVITIGKISQSKMMSAFGKSYSSVAKEGSKGIRMIINVTIFLVYCTILFAYAYLVYDMDEGSKLGIVVTVAVFVNDINLYIMYNARIIRRISVLALIIFCSRLFILLGGSDYWVYGYLVTYVWLECIIALGIVEKRLPFDSEIDINAVDNPSLLKKTKYLDLARVPEFIFVFITLCFVGTIVLASNIEPKGVYLKDLNIGDGISYKGATFVSILFVVTFLCIWCWIRAFKRKIDNTVSDTYMFLLTRKVDQYSIFSITCYMAAVFWSIGIYSFSENENYLVTGFFLPAILYFFFNVIIVYIKNDYSFLESVEILNSNIRAHNKRVTQLKDKAVELRDKINDEGLPGLEAVYGEENARLVQKVMDMELARREAIKLAREIAAPDNEEGKEEDDSIKRSQTGLFGRGITIRKNLKASADLANTRLTPQDDEQESGQMTSKSANPLLEQTNTVHESENPNAMEKMTKTMEGFKLDQESSEEDIDAIPQDKRPYMPSRVDKRRMLIVDWHEKDGSYILEFFQGRMRDNDYLMIWSLIFMSALIIIYGAASVATTEQNLGVMFGFSVLHVVLLVFSMMGNILANRHSTAFESVLQVFSFVMIYIAGIIYFMVRYDTSVLNKDDEDLLLEADRQERDNARNFLVYQLILLPITTCFLAFSAKAYRDNLNGRSMTRGFWILMSLNFVQGIALTVVVFLYGSSEFAWSFVFLLTLGFYGFVQYIMTVTYSNTVMKVGTKVSISPYAQQQAWKWMNGILSILVFGAAVVYSRSDDQTSDFASASIIVMIVLVILGVFVLATWIKDRTQMAESPIYHSPWIFPIYKYYPKDNDVEPYTSSVSIFYAWALLCSFWCITACVEITPSWVGVALTCAMEALCISVTLYFINTNNLQFNKIKHNVDQLVIKQAWLDAKQNLVKMLHIDTRKDYVSYERWWKRRHDLKNYMLVWDNKSVLAWPEDEEFQVVHEEFDHAADKGAFLRQRIEEWADPDEVDLESWQDCQKFMYETDLDVRRAYLAELETIIQFQLIILQNAQALQETERKYLFKFISEKRAQLFLIGVNFELATTGSLAMRYAKVISEIKKMTPDKQTLFDVLKDNFIEEERHQQLVEELAEAEEERKAIERQENLALMSDKRRLKIQAMQNNPNMSIDDMPDSPEKLEKIRKDCRENSKKYTDMEFDHDTDEAEVLGSTIMENPLRKRQVSGWMRASEIPGAVLFRDNASHEDITQGDLGDCYFLSALSVLGNKRTKDLFICQETNDGDEELWKKTGCFMIKFHKDGKLIEIIVDDWLPVQNENLLYTKGGADGLEMWPAILEKAYAKLYGSFSNIEAGKVHMALADMVEHGFPEQLALKSFKNNKKMFEERLRSLEKVEALRGAGSPEGSDTQANEQGIVQGHAYAILKTEDFQGQQLVQLRNPHGAKEDTFEWNGAWCDDDKNWTKKAQETLGYTPNDQIDGIFWMLSSDFLNNFKNIYICRELTAPKWTSLDIAGAWKGISSAGFKGGQNFKNVPQFKLRLTQPCSGYISLAQLGDSGSAYKGKNNIGWMVTRTQGKVMTKFQRRNLVTMTVVSDLKLLSSEIEFDSKVTYPAEYTIICGSQKKGLEGEGEFELKVYTTDKKMELTRYENQYPIEQEE